MEPVVPHALGSEERGLEFDVGGDCFCIFLFNFVCVVFCFGAFLVFAILRDAFDLSQVLDRSDCADD